MGEIGWREVGLSPAVIEQLTLSGFGAPTTLQRQLIPAVLEESDVLTETPGGTGRTVAIAAIVSELVHDCGPGDSPVALVITSDDQRCHELSETIRTIGSTSTRDGATGVRTLVVSDLSPADIDGTEVPCDVVVGTPGRLLGLFNEERLDLAAIEMLIADRADDIVLGDQGSAFMSVLDAVEPDRQKVVTAGALLPPLLDQLSDRLRSPRKITLPNPESVDDPPAQRAFACHSPSPTHVARILATLDHAHPVVVTAADVATSFRNHLDRIGRPTVVTTWDDLMTGADSPPADTPSPGRVVVAVDLPRWSDEYGRILSAASRLGIEEVVLLVRPEHRHLLRALGRVGGVQLNAAPLPTDALIADRRVERTTELVAEQLAKVSAQPTPRFLSSVHRLSSHYDVVDIAAAAMELVHQVLSDQLKPGEDVPVLLRPTGRRPAYGDRRQAQTDASGNRRRGGDRRGKELEPGMTRLFVAAGYNFGVRPGDIVGAFAGESGLSGKEIGNIDIRENFTLVEVPEDLANDVIEAMQTGTIKGRQIEVRRERY